MTEPQQQSLIINSFRLWVSAVSTIHCKIPSLVELTIAVFKGYKDKCLEGNLTGTFILQIYISSSSLHPGWHPSIRYFQWLTIPNVSSLMWRLRTKGKTVGCIFNSHATVIPAGTFWLVCCECTAQSP